MKRRKVVTASIVFLAAFVVSLILYAAFYEAPRREESHFLNNAVQNEENGNFSEAAENYKKVLEDYKHFNQTEKEAPLLAKIAALYYKQNKLPEAEKTLKKAVMLSRDESYFFQLGLLYYEQDKLREAAAVFRRAPHGNPDIQRALSLVAVESKEEKYFQRAQSRHFILKARREEMMQSRGILSILEEAHAKLSKIYPFPLREKSIVKILDDFTFSALTGRAAQNASAVSINGKLFIRSPRLTSIGVNLKEIITHEYVHLLFHKLLPQPEPVWLHEGLAAYFSGEYLDGAHEEAVRGAVRGGNLIAPAALSASWSALAPENRTLAYAESAYLVDYLAATYSWETLYKYIFYLSAGHADEEAAEKIFLTTQPALLKNFTRWLTERKR